MGSRLYSTVLGRFLQVDPVPGGGVNAYAYPPDPINANDYSGESTLSNILVGVGAMILTSMCVASVACGVGMIAGIGAASGLIAYLFDAEPSKLNIRDAAISTGIGALTNAAAGRAVVTGIGAMMYRSTWFGRESYLFRNNRGLPFSPGTPRGGRLNRSDANVRLGWSYNEKVEGHVFALRIGQKPDTTHINFVYGAPRAWTIQ
jgi:hypothetical protein